MNAVEQALDDLKAEFEEFEDGFERYSYLIELASLLPPYPDGKRTKERLIQGCQSNVWLDITPRNGRFYFEADSDTLIIKGVLAILRELLWGQPIEDAVSAKLDLFSALGLTESFSSVRQKGIGYVIGMLQNI